MKIQDILEDKRVNDWPSGACSLFHEIEDYSGSCGRCGWSIEDHEYLHDKRFDRYYEVDDPFCDFCSMRIDEGQKCQCLSSQYPDDR